jgi:hypothetical protein
MPSEATGGKSIKKSSVFEWHIWFKEGHKDMENERSGHPRSHRTYENVEKVQNLVHLDRCLSIRGMAVQLNLDKETVRQIISSDDLGMKMTDSPP